MTARIPNPINNIMQTLKAFGEVPAVYSELVNLGKTYIFNHIMLVNETDQPVIFKLTNESGTKDIELAASRQATLDNFKHNDIIEYKYVSSVPTTGSILQFSW